MKYEIIYKRANERTESTVEFNSMEQAFMFIVYNQPLTIHAIRITKA